MVLGGWAGFVDLARHAVLPVVTLAAVGAAGIARYARSAVADVLDEGWVGMARAKGARPARLYATHILRNVTPMQPDRAGRALASGARCGIGLCGIGVRVAAASARRCSWRFRRGDYPVVMGATVFYAAAVIFANLAADIALPLLDPRRGAHTI